jgi:hypothetical protein
MVGILLTILKILGILLLIILGVILLIILSILLIPLRYQAEGSFHEKEKRAEALISWGLFVIRARAGYEYGKEFFYSLRILGFLILTSGDQKTIFDRFSDLKRSWKKRKTKGQKRKTNVEERRPEKTQSKQEKHFDQITDKTPAKKENPTVSSVKIPDDDQQSVIQKLLQKVKSFVTKIKQIWAKGQWIEDKIEDLYDKYEALERFYYHNKTQYAVQKMMKLLKKVIVYILPVRYKGNLQFGFEDPSLTGKMYGILCMTGIALREDVLVEPDFEEAVCEGDLKISGRIRVIFFVRLALTIFFDKKLKAVYREGKKVLGGMKS